MNRVTLMDMITYLEYGTNLHIGIQFFGDFSNRLLYLPAKRTIHTMAICDDMKTTALGYKKCVYCRNLAFEKALTKKVAFGGYCIQGLYEYVYPLVIDNDVVCIIFVGNIYFDDSKKIKSKISNPSLISTAEYNFDEQKCRTVCKILDEYIQTAMKDTSASVDYNPLIENVKSYILSNLESPLKLSHISHMFHYNEKYLGRLFKQEIGQSFNTYVTQQRLRIAAQKLSNTNESIIGISISTGFSDVSYFNRLFKTKYNCTPTQYRQLHTSQKHDE